MVFTALPQAFVLPVCYLQVQLSLWWLLGLEAKTITAGQAG